MRSGGCTVQQTLTADAAAIVKQAISLARRRGHAQVTPLHVANTMLSSSTGLLRAACLQSHSHPLQCKALELCFNVALNRLPASSSPILSSHHHHHHHPPFLSNALVAAFKRAQAHQRRGFIETQQQPLLAVKIELEQLVISILDDPSVSRVMREAGFSSTQVKSNVENSQSQTLAVESTSRNPSPDDTPKVIIPPTSDGDVRAVIDCLTSGRKRSVVVVGECLATIEGVVRGVMETEMQFIILPLHSFRVMSREEVDFKVGELRCLVKSCCAVGRRAVLYLGDLQWAAEYRMGFGERGRGGYCPVEHVIMEIRSLVCGMMGREGEGRFWLMGIATYHTYMRCKIGDPSLEAAWGLQPLAVPAGSLELSLNCDRDLPMKSGSKQIEAWSALMDLDRVGNQLSCCPDCSIKFEEEVRRLPNNSSSNPDSITSSLPSWLQNCKEDSKRKSSDAQERIQHLCKKWNTICHSSHQNQAHTSDMTLHFSSTSPSSSSISTYNQHNSSLHKVHHAWPIPISTKHAWSTEHQIWMSETSGGGFEPSSRIHLQNHKGQMLPCTNPNPNSTSSSHDSMEMGNSDKFRELNAENLKILCNSLEREVPWQRDIIPEIASTILQCRSGMVRRKDASRLAGKKEEAWLCFLGGDVDGKEKIARKLASLVFGSHSSFISIGLSSFSSTRSGSTDELRNKRSRSGSTNSYLERFMEAIVDDPHRVILLEDIEQFDSYSLIGLKNAIETGRIRSPNGEGHSIFDAIVILSCERFDARSRGSSPSIKHKSGSEDVKDEDTEINSRVYLDLNLSAGGDDDMDLDNLGLLESVDRAFFFQNARGFVTLNHLC